MAYYILFFKKGKNATEMQKKICALYGEGAVTDWTCQKCFVKFLAGDFSLDDAPQSGKQVEVDSNQIKKINWEQSMLYHTVESWHTLNIQINKVIDLENEKCVPYFREKTKRIFWPTR